ncbi:MAG: KOW domain-containing RNA-binding protein [Christensenellaceae bacterium]|nr:KOW domain-containing RNA-binding protein [Christensenellaceae bacterium]
MSYDGFVGSIAISKNGHDKGDCYVITGIVDDRFAFVANGQNRRLEAPKRKNILHLSVTKSRTAATNDLGIRNAIEEFKKRR